MGQKIGPQQPHKGEELKRQKWSYWDLWQATPFMATRQTTSYAAHFNNNNNNNYCNWVVTRWQWLFYM